MEEKSSFSIAFLTLLLITFGSIVPFNLQGQDYDLEFSNFSLSDSVTSGGALLLTGTLKNNGNSPIIPKTSLQMEVIPGPVGSSNTTTPSFSFDAFNNFNNPEILPGATYNFSREIIANRQIFPEENNVVVIVWPLVAPDDVDTSNNVFVTEVYSKMVDNATINKKLESDPVIVTGSMLAGSILLNTPPQDIVGFRYDSSWQQIPIQIDELASKDILTPYGPYRNIIAPTVGNPSGVNALFYTDENTYTGGDPNMDFDEDDELVFMYKDAGNRAITADYPAGVISQTAIEIYVENSAPGAEKYVYVFQQDGSLQQGAGQSYVDYNFELENGAIYPDDFNFLTDEEEENSSITTEHYYWEFDNTWEIDKVRLGTNATEWFVDNEIWTDSDTSSSSFYEGNKCFIANKSGPVRAIRSYMGAGDNPYFQRTHFFYEKRQDISTKVNIDESAQVYGDVWETDETNGSILYRNNIDVSVLPLIEFDEDNDLISSTLYTEIPLQWELFTIPGEGAIISTHELISNYSDLSAQGYLPSPSSDKKAGITFPMDQLCTVPFGCTQDNYIQHWRRILFDTLGARVEDASSYTDWTQIPLNVSWENYLTCQAPKINVLLEGVMDKNTGKHKTSLYDMELLPGQSANPASIINSYSEFPWYLDTPIEYALYDSTTVDWLVVGFRSDLTQGSTDIQTLALLHKEGTIEFHDKCLLYNIEEDSLYITIEHRNHLGIISPTAIPLSLGNEIEYDFRTQDAYNAGNTRSGQKEILPGTWVMIGGDGAKTSWTNDINGDDKSFWSGDSGIFNIYSSSDYNMDGEVSGADKVLWFSNNGRYGALPK